jgi:cephalosporin hydroxylase
MTRSPFARPNNRLTRALDRWAARRVLRAMIGKTENLFTVRWLGKQMWQCPIDAWVMQEVISEQRPDLIIETGTFMGGSAYYFGCLCELLNHGEVISIDIAARETIPHPRVTYIADSSVSDRVITQLKDHIEQIQARKILIVLDSDHSEAHVSQELELYSKLVPVGCYLMVQDACIDEYAVFAVDRPGPGPAIRKFLAHQTQFVRDRELENRYVVTFHPMGWLRRVA